MKDNDKKGFKIPEDPRRLAKLTWKKFKKEYEDSYSDKKELRRAYYGEIIDLLPESIALIVRYGHLPEVKETKTAIYSKITDEKFVKYLTKQVKDDLEFDNLILIPWVVSDIMKEVAAQIEKSKEENLTSEGIVTFDVNDLIELSKLILKKKLKKFVKAGINETVAFEVLSVIPTPEIMNKSQQYHVRALFTKLYALAKDNVVDFSTIMKLLFKDDESAISGIISFALLERKEKVATFTATQQALYNAITEYCFKELEEMPKELIITILTNYANCRKRDEEQNKDANRRYYISSLPENDYPRILKAVNKVVQNNESLRKYF